MKLISPLNDSKFKMSNGQMILNGVNGPGFDKIIQKINELIFFILKIKSKRLKTNL